jgi:hypothetical protein
VSGRRLTAVGIALPDLVIHLHGRTNGGSIWIKR